MASEKITALVEEVKGLTVLELSELVHTLEEVFGVSAAAASLALAFIGAPCRGVGRPSTCEIPSLANSMTTTWSRKGSPRSQHLPIRKQRRSHNHRLRCLVPLLWIAMPVPRTPTVNTR